VKLLRQMDKKTYKWNYKKYREQKLAYYRQNREKILAQVKARHLANPAPGRARAKKQREQNREKFLAYLKDWRQKNKARASEQVRLCHAKKRQSDPLYKLQLRLRWRLWSVVRGIKGYTRKTSELLGCSLTELKNWLEKQFQPGMSWDNYGEWHIDHIIPCAAFNFANESEQKACFHYKNLQPLWARENASKGGTGQYRPKSQSVERPARDYTPTRKGRYSPSCMATCRDGQKWPVPSQKDE